MKKLLFLLITIATMMSCQDEIIPEPEVLVDETNKVEILSLINQARTEFCEYVRPDGVGVYMNTDYLNLGKLEWNDELYKAAQIHSLHMYNTGEFDHVWKDGTTLYKRLEIVGCKYNPVGENIAKGYPNEKTVFQGWLDSDGHRNNILNKNFNIVAVANKDGYWTMVLGYKSN